MYGPDNRDAALRQIPEQDWIIQKISVYIVYMNDVGLNTCYLADEFPGCLG